MLLLLIIIDFQVHVPGARCVRSKIRMARETSRRLLRLLNVLTQVKEKDRVERQASGAPNVVPVTESPVHQAPNHYPGQLHDTQRQSKYVPACDEKHKLANRAPYCL